MEEPRVEVGESGMTLDEIVQDVLVRCAGYRREGIWSAYPRIIDLMADYELTDDEAMLVVEEVKHHVT